MKSEAIDDILPLILDYQQNPSEEKLNVIVEMVAPYIRNYPQFAFRKGDEDIKSDFFLYVYERFAGFVQKYDHNLSNFSTYLSIKLKNHFLNYLRREQSRNKIDIVSYEIDSISEVIFQESETVWKVSEEEHIEDKSAKVEKDIFFSSEKNPFRYLCVKLYYFDFFSDSDFLLLKKFTKKSYSDLLHEINHFAEQVAQKKRNKLKYEYRLNKLHHKIIKISQELKNSTSSQQASEMERLELRKKLNEKKEEVLSKYNSISVRPTMRSVAQLLSVETNKVQNIINYFKSSVKKRDYKE